MPIKLGSYSCRMGIMACSVDAQNPKIDGVIAMDEGLVADLGEYDTDRCVIVAKKGSRRIASLFEEGVSDLVFATDSLKTARLAILAAELRLGNANGL